jgi:hypothetical protein
MGDSPYFDFLVTIISASVFPAELDPEIQGRIHVDGEGVHERPDFQQATEGDTSRSLESLDANWTVRRNVPITIRLRQQVLPRVAQKLLTENASVSFDQLDIALRFIRTSREGLNRARAIGSQSAMRFVSDAGRSPLPPGSRTPQ